MDTRERLVYWIKERHNIYLKRKMGLPKPWTEDPILQSTFFTCPYRELDKTTVWFAENIRGDAKTKDAMVFVCIAFRWFNLINTGAVLHGNGLPFDKRINHGGSLWWNWNTYHAKQRLMKVEGPVFTGAYMIKAGNGPPGCKMNNVCEAIEKIFNQKKWMAEEIDHVNSLEYAWRMFTRITHIGPFMAAQIVADLKYTPLLGSAHDWHEWCVLGPGSTRGLNRMLGRDVHASAPKDWKYQMTELREHVNNELVKLHKPEMHMQDVQNCLCEYDKYERVRHQDGKIKRNYKGV
jgi:hypothetical protein